MAIGRSTEPRTNATVDTTNTDATITFDSGTINEEDVGATISGTGIPAGTTIASLTNATTAEMSANATADGTNVSATIRPVAANYGFHGWSPETDAESETYSVTATHANQPSILDDDVTPVEQRSRTY